MRVNNFQNQYQKEEFDRILNPGKTSNPLSVFSLMNKCIEQADTSGDGVLSDEEISVFMAKNTSEIISELDKEFGNFSQDIDAGLLTDLMNTVKNMVSQNNTVSEQTESLEGINQEDFIKSADEALNSEDSSEFWQLVGADGAEKVFGKMDADGDGILSKEELAALSGADGDDETVSLTDLSQIFSSDPEAITEPYKIGDETSIEKPEDTETTTEETEETQKTEKPKTEDTGSTGSSSPAVSIDYDTTGDNEVKEKERTEEQIDSEIKEQENKKTDTKNSAETAIEEQQKLIDAAVQGSGLSDKFKEEYDSENTRLQGLIDDKDKEIENQNTIITDANAQADAYATAATEISSQISTMESEKAKLDSSKDSDKIDDYNTKIQNLRNKKTELEEKEKAEKKKAEDATTAKERLEEEKTDLETEKENILDTLSEKYQDEKDKIEALKTTIQEYQANITEIKANLAKDIAEIDNNIQKLKTEKANLVQKTETTKVIDENRVIPDNSPVAINGDVQNYDWASLGYNAEAGQKLANGTYQYANGREGSHNCLGGVKHGFVNATGNCPFGLPEQGIHSAYQAAGILEKDENFREVTGIGIDDLKYLPAGAVVIWSKSSSGDSPASKHGHASVSLGNGYEASDHICKQYRHVGSDGKPRVFLPLSI